MKHAISIPSLISDRGNMQFVVQSIGLPDVNLTFSSTSDSAQSITPIYTDDLVGLEDTESLDFVLKAVSDPAQIDFSGRIPRANVTVLDNEGTYVYKVTGNGRIISKELIIYTICDHVCGNRAFVGKIEF